MSEYLLDKLTEYTTSDAYPLHMPGHKRQMRTFQDSFAIDITEIDGFDNLHHAEGILLEAQRRAARLYGADETYYLVNGSTCGILAAVSAAVRRGDRILMARNSHKAAYHAALLNGLRVTWLYPETDLRRGICGSICPEQVRSALAVNLHSRENGAFVQSGHSSWTAGNPAESEYEDSRQENAGTNDRIAAVLITSPTYDGVVSDIRAIAEEVHRAGAILIVDEAHGAHFAMHPYFPDSALSCGADVVINSLHKTMPSLTQTALLHVKGPRADRERLRKYLGIFQSSSPSYVLMAGMDECVRLMETQKEELFDCFVRRLQALREHLGRMKHLHLVSGKEADLHAFLFDRSKILISVEPGGKLTGPGLANIMRKRYHLEVEMAAERYVTAIMTAADTQEGFERLERALLETDAWLKSENEDGRRVSGSEEAVTGSASGEGTDVEDALILPRPEGCITMAEADELPKEAVSLRDSPGRIAAEFVYLYPPGIPLLVPGERIPAELPGLLARYRESGLNVQGLADYSAGTIRCVADGFQRRDNPVRG
ncbi:MAG: PLP-dependent transferase [Lachnospiraceae bacterium]|nr:PLP-dependent transferase [Lachnospiraceae bacterium]